MSAQLQRVERNRFGQPECPDCQLTMRHEERSNTETRTMHHNNIYECPECGRRLVSG